MKRFLLCLVLCLAAGGPAFGAGMPLACQINALNDRERGRRETLIEELMPTAQVVETADGYQITWAGSPQVYGQVAEFIGFERRCCPFLDFSLRVSGPNDPVVLTLQGDEDIKAFIRESGLLEGKP